MAEPVTTAILGGAVAGTIWTGVYAGARDGGKSHEEAVQKANKAVKKTIGTVGFMTAGSIMDSSAQTIQRSSGTNA